MKLDTTEQYEALVNHTVRNGLDVTITLQRTGKNIAAFPDVAALPDRFRCTPLADDGFNDDAGSYGFAAQLPNGNTVFIGKAFIRNVSVCSKKG